MVALGERELHPDQLISLQQELKRPYPDARALLVWGRYIRAAGKYDSAMKVFIRAALAGEDRARLALERSRTYRGMGDTAAAREAYWDGLEKPSADGRIAYRYDLAWIVGADSLSMFDQLPADSVADWVHRFWDERDAAAANVFGDRLQEHLRRWVTAVARYRVKKAWRKTDFTRTDFVFDGINPCVKGDTEFYEDIWAAQPNYPDDIRDRERLLDQRGLIYLRHGEPIARFGRLRLTDGEGILPPGRLRPPFYTTRQQMYNNVSWLSWLYWFEGGWRMLNFRGSAAFGIEAATTLGSFLPVGREYYNDVANGVMPEYSDALSVLMKGSVFPTCLAAVKKAVAKAREDAHLSIITDSDTPPLNDPWAGVLGMLALGHAAEKNGKALITFAVPTRKLRTAVDEHYRQIWPVNFRIVAYQATTGEQRVIDTMRVFTIPPDHANDSYLTNWFELPLGAGTWEIGMRVNQGKDSSGMYALNRHVVISAEPVLSLSDVVLGVAGARNWIAPDHVGFPVNAFSSWKQNTKVETYFEVRGVPDGESYQTSIQIRLPDSLAKPLIDVKSNDLATGAMTAVRKSIGLELLTPGKYVMVVTVTANGRAVERKTMFTVLKP